MEKCKNCGLVPKSKIHYDICRFMYRSTLRELDYDILNTKKPTSRPMFIKKKNQCHKSSESKTCAPCTSRK